MAKTAVTRTDTGPAPEARSLLVEMADRAGVEPKTFVDALRATVVPKETTNEEFAAFLMVAKKHNLDPFLREIYAFPKRGGGIQPIVSIDGWVNLVNSHPAYDGVEFDDHLEDGGLVAVTARMWRKDQSHPTVVTEYMSECARATEPWKQWPRRMLRHKAMIQVARYAFGFSGIADPDEGERMLSDVTTMRNVTERQQQRQRLESSRAALDYFAGQDEAEHHETAPSDGIASDVSGAAPDHPPSDEPDEGSSTPSGAATSSAPQKNEPKNYAEYRERFDAIVERATDAKQLNDWFRSEGERRRRNASGVVEEERLAMVAALDKRIAALTGDTRT